MIKYKRLKVKIVTSRKLKFIDLFVGIGGFHIALKSLGMECVFTSENDEYSRKTYAANFKDKYLNDPNLFVGDIWKVILKKYQTLIFYVVVFLASHFLKLDIKKASRIIKMEICFFQLRNIKN